MKHLIKKILKESAEKKFIKHIVNKIKSGEFKPPYAKNLKKMGLNLYEVADIIDLIKYDEKGREIYHESPDGYWRKVKFDDNGNRTYFEDHTGEWTKWEYDQNGNLIYKEYSDGRWMKWGYDEEGEEIYNIASDDYDNETID